MANHKKSCLVTGATSGLGHYCATVLAESGWSVTATGRRPQSEADLPEAVRYVSVDLSSESAVLELAGEFETCPDMVVHSGVLYPPSDHDGNPDYATMSRIFQVNAFAPIRLSEALLKSKPQDRCVSFVFINSEAMFAADGHAGPYAASKAALRVLTASFAHRCRDQNAKASTLLLGPLGNYKKQQELAAIAQKRGVPTEEITRIFLRKSNPNLVIDALIDFNECLRSVLYIESLGTVANGMVCRLDGGSAGSLI